MEKYTMTVFEKNGEKLVDESFEAANEKEAAILGEKMLEEKGYHEYTYRIVTSYGKLIGFHR